MEDNKAREWYIKNRIYFSDSEIEKLCDIPRGGIYKDLSGRQKLRSGTWSRVYSFMQKVIWGIYN